MAQEHTNTKTPPPAKARRERRVPKRMTLREFDAFDTNPDEKWELIEGVSCMSPSPTLPHNQLLDVLKAYFVQHLQLSEGWVVARDTSVRIPKVESVLRPDLAVYRKDELGSTHTFPLRATPRLVVEASSPSTVDYDFDKKLKLYCKAGVPEYWVVDPKTGAISLFVLKKSEYDQLSVDPKGRIRSPLLKRWLKIIVEEWTFRIES